MLDPTMLVILSAAALGAGMLNAVAGGGTFLTLPALVFVGLPPIMANTTSAAVVLPGYASAAWGFRGALRDVPVRRFVTLIFITVIGAVLGAQLLIGTSDEVFRLLAPYLILFATGLFMFGPLLKAWFEKKNGATLVGALGVGAVSAYGGYFNGGLGIALLSVLNISGARDLNESNGLKSLLSFVLTLVSVSAFTLAGNIQWSTAVFMMFFCALGGFLGARLALVIPVQSLRIFIIVLGLSMSLSLFLF